MSHTRCIIESELFNKEDLAQFQAIQKHFNWDEPTTRAKIGTWMTLKDTDELPTVEDMKTYEKTYGKKITVKNTEYTAEMQQIKDQTIANGTFMKAPNGKPTNLNEKQWLQVRTKTFKKWFGDWEKAPANASKIVDENEGLSFSFLLNIVVR